MNTGEPCALWEREYSRWSITNNPPVKWDTNPGSETGQKLRVLYEHHQQISGVAVVSPLFLSYHQYNGEPKGGISRGRLS